MSENYKQFLRNAEKKAFDIDHRTIINNNMDRYKVSIIKGRKQFKNLENAKQRAAVIKNRVIHDLDKYLIKFERNFTDHGGKVIWAQNKKEAVKEIMAIMKANRAKMVVKSKSMTTEEIEINEALEKNKIESVETDLGEYIVQIAGEKPYHIVTPAMHKSKESIAGLFNEKFGTPQDYTPEDITVFVRQKLRDKFITADIGITGANFLLPDIGAVGLTENEGNGMMSFSFPRIHIVVAGIEKIIPSVEDLHLFWPLLASHASGQYISAYNSIISGPRQNGETDGPEEMYVVLLDNNRTEVLKQTEQRRALSCIRCGACLNACPVYRNIGGHTYDTTYTGPIGAVISPFLNGFKEYSHLSFASSLCGSCTEICPVKINLHELLLINRNEYVKRNHPPFGEKLIMKGWKTIMKKRKKMDLLSPGIKNKGMKLFLSKAWGPRRTIPEIKQNSFREAWIEKRENK